MRQGVQYFNHKPWKTHDKLKIVDERYVSTASIQKHLDISKSTWKRLIENYRIKKGNLYAISINDMCDLIERNKLFGNDRERTIAISDLLSLLPDEKKEYVVNRHCCCYSLINKINLWIYG